MAEDKHSSARDTLSFLYNKSWDYGKIVII